MVKVKAEEVCSVIGRKAFPQIPKTLHQASTSKEESFKWSSKKQGKKGSKKGKNASSDSSTPVEEKGAGMIARNILSNLGLFGSRNGGSGSQTSEGASCVQVEEENAAKRSMSSRKPRRETPVLVSVDCSATTSPSRENGSVLDADSSSTKSGRRPSVDTVSTYLSQETEAAGDSSGNMRRTSSRGLFCEEGDCDVFGPPLPLPPPPPPPKTRKPKRNPVMKASPLPVVPPKIGQWTTQNDSIAFVLFSGLDPGSDILSQYVRLVANPPTDCHCPICLCCFASRSSGSMDMNLEMVVALTLCDHLMHLSCLNSMLQSISNRAKSLYIQCPVCMKIYGMKTGNQPAGTMDWAVLNSSLPGHPGTCTIQITYNITSGIQGTEHPNPGRPFYAVGFPRVCYLPDTPKGRKVLRLLQIAFERRLVFTVGRSVTTGREDVVTWNEIHHKTEAGPVGNHAMGGSSLGHGYPDPGYLDNVLHELAAHGVYDHNAEANELFDREEEEDDDEEEEESDGWSSHWSNDGVLYQEVC
ncbi:hypothetical protein J437_LFUL008619 [Ladona fulva]|uniref:E3 ubiquitin-protein ligase n=1 Tax=Ladona fulva TaxID=123851 RepID=A0A8K0KCI3_LADFU|nr:hypothetical protein J437_LFUL008619 [Ladona fulva]